jgi:hypothetical protein
MINEEGMNQNPKPLAALHVKRPRGVEGMNQNPRWRCGMAAYPVVDSPKNS